MYLLSHLYNILFPVLLKINYLLLLSLILRVKYCVWSCPSHKSEVNPVSGGAGIQHKRYTSACDITM